MKTVLMEEGTWKRLKLRAVAQGIPLQTLVERALTVWLTGEGGSNGPGVAGDVEASGGGVADGREVGHAGAGSGESGHAGVATDLDVVGPASAGRVGKGTTRRQR